MNQINKYDRLLIELGETKTKESGSSLFGCASWRPEFQLLAMSLLNAVFFIVIKLNYY